MFKIGLARNYTARADQLVEDGDLAQDILLLCQPSATEEAPMTAKAQRRPNKLTQLFAAQADIVTAEMGSKAQEDAGDRRDKALAKLTPQEREDMEIVCLALAAMCKRKPA